MDAVMNTQPATPGNASEDDQERMRQRELMQHAAAQATFHRCEAEKWQRMGRSAAASLAMLDQPSPVESVDSDVLYDQAFKESQRDQAKTAEFSGQTAQSGAVYSN